METSELKREFIRLMRKYSEDIEYISNCWNEIERAYTQNSRHYHSLIHIAFMIRKAKKIEPSIEDFDTLLFSIYYHDIIYKATKSDNEYQSSLILEKRLSPTQFPSIKKCMQQIEQSKTHLLSKESDTNYFLDIDLGILGQPWNVYSEYAKNVRKEYAIYPDFMYNRGRKKVLNHILNSENIYKTNYFGEKYEDQAKINLLKELEQLN